MVTRLLKAIKIRKESEFEYDGSNHDWNRKCEIILWGEKGNKLKSLCIMIEYWRQVKKCYTKLLIAGI